jgi:hypothetical protein
MEEVAPTPKIKKKKANEVEGEQDKVEGENDTK